jgi:hypothetical protein
MFNDRDLILMGLGALLAIFCLFLPMPFILKAFLGGFLLVGAMVVALLRLGPDRVPLEVWLKRRWGFGRKPKRYAYHHPKPEPKKQPVPMPQPDKSLNEEIPASSVVMKPSSHNPETAPLVAFQPVDLAWEEISTYNLVRLWLLVVGIYVVYWIFQGGAEEIVFTLKTMGLW